MAASSGRVIDDVRWSLRVRSRLRGLLRRRRTRTPSGEDVDPGVRPSLAARLGLVAIVGGYVVAFCFWTLRQHYEFGTWAFDLGIFDQGTWLLSRFKEPFVTVRGLNLFGDHTSFILVALVPFYWLFSSAAVLLVAQSVALGMGALPAFLIARDKLQSEPVALLVAVAYLVNPVIAWTNHEQFHPESFEVPLILFALYFTFKKRWTPYLVSVVLLLLVKEDVPLLTAALGVYVFFRHDRKVGAMTTGLSVVWFAIDLWVLLPLFSDGGSLYTGRVLDQFGGIGGFIRTVVTRPWDIAAIAVRSPKPWYVWQLLAPFALLPLLAPGLLLVASLPLVANLITTWGYAHDIHFHYSTLIVPVLVCAAVLGIARFRAPIVRTGLATVLAACAIAAGWLWGPAPFARNPAFYASPHHAQLAAARSAISLIPDGKGVSAGYPFVPHLSGRVSIYMFPNPWTPSFYGADGTEPPDPSTVDYVIVSPTGAFDAFGTFVNEANLALIDSLPDMGFVRIYDREGIVVFRRQTA